MNHLRPIFSITLFALILIGYTPAVAQRQERIVQVSGLVVEGDSLYGIPGVAVYQARSGRGTISNSVGYFSFVTYRGDTLTVNSMGYRTRTFIVPIAKGADTSDHISVIIEMMEDTMLFPVVDIYPWPTEKLFKDAFLALKLPEQEYLNAQKNLNEQIMERLLYTSTASANENYRYYMQKQQMATENRGALALSPNGVPLTFLNPFAWANFIKDVRKGGLKSTLKKAEPEIDE